ncbi:MULTISPECIES: YhgE/Pip domain-containing protein [unclassified Corynebacterium]|uniref:YhgE/Pip domain-containing protein n=1 Tax=unclassified Corynebacterium TaxID=2624378 RepID=UPI0029C9D92F|nr:MULTISPECIES: YhgE/Pip domain-containing protein [unclassified Corynebacterium]WPF66301.1 YhgE/Pip domain-containing protein [Corynebacterium sp. 22KM0430]WPF68791.1 YhgE/Pip domain-containing protein [Corynebacterium sp. 21KM1197]
MSAVRSTLLFSLTLVPLLAGAVYLTVAGQGPEKSWSAGEEPQAAPAAATAQLMEARRAAIDAGTNASFLANGTAQLLDGVSKFQSGEISGDVQRLRDGAAQLRDGMIQLQAATGQLGQGATELADGVGGAMDKILALGVIQGQLDEAASSLDQELEKSTDPRAQDLRGQLADFRAQLANGGLGEETTGQLTRLRDGSRDLANQLAVPGYGFHDGIYSATDGAKRLASGIEEAQGGVAGALDSMGQLDSGARQLNDMAQENRTRVQGIQRALPVAQAGVEQEARAELLPMYALLISVFAALGGLGAGFLRRAGDRLLAGGAVVAASGGLLWLMGTALSWQTLAAGTGVLALAVGAFAGLGAGLRHVAGTRGAVIGGALVLLAQVGVAGWVWKSAMTSDLSSAWAAVAGLTPVHYATGALSALSNGGSVALVWVAVAVLGAMVLLGGVARWGLARR